MSIKDRGSNDIQFLDNNLFADKVKQMVASGVTGAVTDPIKLGFIINDIRILANKKFVNDNPAAKNYLKSFTCQSRISQPRTPV